MNNSNNDNLINSNSINQNNNQFSNIQSNNNSFNNLVNKLSTDNENFDNIFFNNNQVFSDTINNNNNNVIGINNQIYMSDNSNQGLNNNDISINNISINTTNNNSDVFFPNAVYFDKINDNDDSDDSLKNSNLNNNSNKKEYVFDDGLDSDDNDGKFSIIKFLSNRKFLMVLSVFIFVFVSIVVVKAFYFGDKIDNYEEFFTVIDSKDEDSVVVSNDSMNDIKIEGDAATKLINCIKSSIDVENLPDNIRNVINDINNYYNQSNDYFSFVYKDLVTGFMVSYNANQTIFSASSIKAPTDIYIWEMASSGKINLNERLTYTSGYYNTGSGLLKNKKFNTNYSVRELLGYSTIDSDNAAHNMLMDKYGRENMLNFWKEKGTKSIFTLNNNWGLISGYDAAIYMEELYKFYTRDNVYGKDAMNNFIKAYPKFLKGKSNYKIASKSGWAGSSLHDIAIIFADNPYVLVALSNLGDKGNYNSYFNTASELADRLHTEYWKYKINICNNIPQY